MPTLPRRWLHIVSASSGFHRSTAADDGPWPDDRVSSCAFAIARYRGLPRVSDVGWVGQGSLIAVSSLALDTVTLDLFKLGGIVVLTEELIRYSAPGAEDAVRADMLAAMAKFSDQALLDPAQAGEAGVSPASITNGATTIVSTGSTALLIAADLRSLFNVLADAGINFLAPYLITLAAHRDCAEFKNGHRWCACISWRYRQGWRARWRSIAGVE